MLWTNIKDISIPFLHDAALVLSHRKAFRLKNIYMDKSGGCAISYYGKLTENQIKEVMLNFFYPLEDRSIDRIVPVYGQDYHYLDGMTILYTPDGVDYRVLDSLDYRNIEVH